MRRRNDLILGLAGSALLHAAAFATGIIGMGKPSPMAAQSAIPVTLVLERASDSVAQSDGALSSLPLVPEETATPQLAPILPTLHAVAIPPQPARPAAEKRSKRGGRPHPLDTAVAAPLVQAPDPANPPAMTSAAPPPPAGALAALAGEDKAGEPSNRASEPSAIPATASPLSNDYLASVMAWLERHKEYPDEARSRQDEGSVLVAFVIDHAGQVLSVDIQRGSGSAILDRAAEDMLRRASPLPPPPPSYPAQQLRMTLPLKFSLQ